MRSTIIITKRGPGYISDVSGKFGSGHKGARCGLTPYDAAARAAKLMIEYGQGNPEGADLMAPPEVQELVPQHLRSIAPKPLATRKAVLRHSDSRGFIFADPDTGACLADVEVGNLQEEVDWDLIEAQATALGYILVDGDK